jgi:hypothetical protein
MVRFRKVNLGFSLFLNNKINDSDNLDHLFSSSVSGLIKNEICRKINQNDVFLFGGCWWEFGSDKEE